MAIPIVDLSILLEKLTATKEKWEITALDLKQALTKTGFVYLRNHGISQNTVGFKLSCIKKQLIFE